MEPIVSVIICTHNPRRDYITKVLGALKSQTLSMELWELLLVDNASNEILSSELDLSWHPRNRHLREENLGLTPARLRGIKEAQGNLLIFVDDDNVLEPDYLEEAIHILKEYPFLGAFGGHISAETDSPLEAWQEPFLSFLAVREVRQPVWGNRSFSGQNVPYGAGICIKREVAYRYYEVTQEDPLRLRLDRRGNLLSSAGDLDLALTAHDCGYATGLFPNLRLNHLIPTTRLQEEYLLRLKREGGMSSYILEYLRYGNIPSIQKKSFLRHLIDKIRLMKHEPIYRKMIQAEIMAKQQALEEIFKFQKTIEE
ncbi:glycosyltransferase [Leptolyngbya sp. NK1-12]|uniref:Glycosyltransferase n=1 Tax=Leptolyngbya sp. NK1-12 TaxID=2547451 RepID=A0AA96WKV4_9CYAN|nr:glycosyltransferase [Leptolyngbya sp. NK1-12]